MCDECRVLMAIYPYVLKINWYYAVRSELFFNTSWWDDWNTIPTFQFLYWIILQNSNEMMFSSPLLCHPLNFFSDFQIIDIYENYKENALIFILLILFSKIHLVRKMGKIYLNFQLCCWLIFSIYLWTSIMDNNEMNRICGTDPYA